MDRKLAILIEALVQRVRGFPDEAFEDLFRALDSIEKKYDLIEHLSDEDKRAIAESRESLARGEGVPLKELEIFKRLKGFDRDAAGKESFLDVIGRVKTLAGEEQGDVATVIYALLNEYQWDIPSPPKKN